MCVCVSHSVVSDSLRPHELQPARLLYPWNSPGKSYGVDAISFSGGIRTSKFSKEDRLRYGLLQRTVGDLEKEGNFIWLGKSWIQYDAFLKIRVLSK